MSARPFASAPLWLLRFMLARRLFRPLWIEIWNEMWRRGRDDGGAP
ncbi:MAG: hypothetical protein JWP97_5747 [Labilithrix sp.]|nr:hypothetical protein [Labilithrix sp.]